MPARILVIEDNPTNLELMVYLLEAFGHIVQAAHNGEEGLQALEHEPPDLIICDLEMPKINGYEVARQLKNHPQLKTIPLVAVTAFAMVGDREKVLAAGFNGYIIKPIDPETFVQQIEAFLRLDQAQPRPVAPPQAKAMPAISSDGKPTILVLDNSPANLILMYSLLKPYGYKVIEAKNVTEALALTRKHLPDLIISDLHMPGQGGYDFIKFAKGDSKLRQIPFILISSTVWRDEDPERGMSLGAVRFLLRPIEPEEFLAQVEACLQERGG